jgi:preprotein translocase subunit SecD
VAKSVGSCISAGFSKAFSAIFDSNLTTIISAVFLFQFGTGPIRGYAVTLTISLMANLFTAVFVSRVMFDLIVPKTAKTLSI